jgi:hypothetical protein
MLLVLCVTYISSTCYQEKKRIATYTEEVAGPIPSEYPLKSGGPDGAYDFVITSRLLILLSIDFGSLFLFIFVHFVSRFH